MVPLKSWRVSCVRFPDRRSWCSRSCSGSSRRLCCVGACGCRTCSACPGRRPGPGGCSRTRGVEDLLLRAADERLRAPRRRCRSTARPVPIDCRTPNWRHSLVNEFAVYVAPLSVWKMTRFVSSLRQPGRLTASSSKQMIVCGTPVLRPLLGDQACHTHRRLLHPPDLRIT